MHIDHKPGIDRHIDFSGKSLFVTDPVPGEIRAVEVFVGTLRCSYYTCEEAMETQRKILFTSHGRITEIDVCNLAEVLVFIST